MNRLEVIRQSATGAYQPASEYQLVSAQALLVFSYGARSFSGEEEPGPKNAEIASAVTEYCLERDSQFLRPLPIISEWEVAECLEMKGILPDVVVRPDPKIDNGYVHTRSVVDAFKIWRENYSKAHEMHIGRVAGAAFANHWPRGKQEIRRLGVSAYPIPNLPTEFDPQSSEWWTRSRFKWTLHEVGMQAVLPVIDTFPSAFERTRDFITNQKVMRSR